LKQTNWLTADHPLLRGWFAIGNLVGPAEQPTLGNLYLTRSYKLAQRMLSRQPMGHICYVIGSLDIGGTERHLSQIAIAMKGRGWTVTIACLTHKGTLAPEVESAGVEVLSSRIGPTGNRLGIIKRAVRMISEAGRLARTLAVRRPDIAHFFLPDAYVLGGILAVVAGVPIRIMSRRSLNLYQSRRPVARFVEGRLHNRMTAVLINAMPQLHDLVTIEGCQPQRIGLIYNGVDTTRFRPASDRTKLREAFKLDTNAFIMICVANLIPYKGHADLFEALARITAQLPRAWRLLCVGRRENYGVELESLAESLGISAQIDFLGECADVSFLLQTADIGILPSHEGMSNVILEAMATALPMIATNVGGNAEAIVNAESGIIVPPRDISMLAEAILFLARDAQSRVRLGKAGRERAVAHFGLEHCADLYDTLYAQLMEGKPISDLGEFIPRLRQ